MEPDRYKVEVLHFINPYLIWVEIPDLAEDETNFPFEQVGIYGVLPLEMRLDPAADTLTALRSKKWMPAAAVLMKKAFSDAVEISFAPIRIDKRSTIFDDNVHKYGEIIIKKRNGKHRILSELLVKSGFGIQDEEAFESELINGNVKTKLNHKDSKEVIKIIEKKCKSKLSKQTKVFQTAEQIESELTVNNLEAHNLRNKHKISADGLLRKKFNDLQMCKEAEAESLGRASKKTMKNDSDSSSLVKKQEVNQEVTKSETQRQKDHNATKKVTNETHTPSKKPGDADSNDDVNQFNACTKIQSTPISPQISKKYVDAEKERNDLTVTNEFENKRTNPAQCCENGDFEDNFFRKVKKPKQTRCSTNSLPGINKHKEMRVVRGPPGMNIRDLPVKVVSKEVFNEHQVYEKNQECPVNEIKEDYAEEDSDVYEGCYNKVEIPKIETFSTPVLRKTIGHVFANPEVKTNNDIPRIQETVKSNNLNDSPCDKSGTGCSSFKRRFHLIKYGKNSDCSNTDTSTKDSSSSTEDEKISSDKHFAVSSNLDSDDSSSEIIKEINALYTPIAFPKEETGKKMAEQYIHEKQVKLNVNPFKNFDADLSVFVERLVTPILMVHSKMNKRFQPKMSMGDISFSSNIQNILKNMNVEHPMTIQTITWQAILRGYSTIIVGPKGSGKTVGYLPAVCTLVTNHWCDIVSNGPSCVIVCATSFLVSQIEDLSKRFCRTEAKVLGLYSGMDDQNIATSLLNGCDVLVTTPTVLVRALQDEHGVDFKRLTTFVLDDFERLSEIYMKEIKFINFKIKEMLKTRISQEVRVQYVLASRVWCDFIESITKKVPDPVVCISAFQECVLYSKTHTVASFVTKDIKHNAVLEFLNNIDNSKRTVIVCREDEEVNELEKIIRDAKYVVFACNSEMTVQDLYNLRYAWDVYKEPVLGPILVCCDGNLAHLNVTDAHYLLHYSLPHLYSTFCKRFAVLTENYASIFEDNKEDVKIKILLEDSNIEQLPKILNFIKRCTTDVPKVLDDACERILKDKDFAKASKLVPICNNLLAFGECPDFWNCKERHAVFKDFDKSDWVPQDGIITFKILHFHTATYYSARLLTHLANGETVQYPQVYNTLAMKIAMHFGLESNRKLHGIPKVGDICAVSMTQNHHLRCQVLKIQSLYQNGKPNEVLVKLIDEERYISTRDIYLYQLPEHLKSPKTHVVHVRLANVKPRDNDITFSELAKQELKQKVPDSEEKDVYMRGQVALTVGNCVFVNNIEVCRKILISKPVVIDDFKKVLLEGHAVPNPDHLEKLTELCEREEIIKSEPQVIDTAVDHSEAKLPQPQWAHLETEGLSEVYFEYAKDPGTFFLRLAKFADCCTALLKDIQKHVNENPSLIRKVKKGDLVLAKIQDEDEMYERAKVEKIVDDDHVVCFFVDQGFWCEVPKENLQPITEKLITQLPFQAIECRLLAVEPVGNEWSEWVSNCFSNICLADNPADKNDKIIKLLFAQYFVKEKANHTDGRKYGIVLIDTTTEHDIILNKMMVDSNLAQIKESEAHFLEKLNFIYNALESEKNIKENENKCGIDTDKGEEDWEKISVSKKSDDSEEIEHVTATESKISGKFIRSVPLVEDDGFDTSEQNWDIQVGDEFKGMFNMFVKSATQGGDPCKFNTKPDDLENSKPYKDEKKAVAVLALSQNASHKSSSSDTSMSSIQKDSSSSDIQVISTPRLVELDSDDLTSPLSSQVSSSSGRSPKLDLILKISKRISPTVQRAIESEIPKQKSEDVDLLRKPKLSWHQKGLTLSIKILLVGVKKYDVEIRERRVKFEGEANETKYGFALELYGLIDPKKSRHSNKGQYVLIKLTKILKRNWLSLCKTEGVKKWIMYDVDSLDYSSSEDEGKGKDEDKKIMKNICKDYFRNSDSEDEEFIDDAAFQYSR